MPVSISTLRTLHFDLRRFQRRADGAIPQESPKTVPFPATTRLPSGFDGHNPADSCDIGSR